MTFLVLFDHQVRNSPLRVWQALDERTNMD